MYEVQRRYRQRDWDFASTVWSKTTFVLAKRHHKLRPSPAKGRSNIERAFSQRMHRAFDALMRRGLATRRSIKGPDAPAKFAQGYKRHKARNRDTFLTGDGLDRAEALLRARGLMAAPEPAGCDD